MSKIRFQHSHASGFVDLDPDEIRFITPHFSTPDVVVINTATPWRTCRKTLEVYRERERFFAPLDMDLLGSLLDLVDQRPDLVTLYTARGDILASAKEIRGVKAHRDDPARSVIWLGEEKEYAFVSMTFEEILLRLADAS